MTREPIANVEAEQSVLAAMMLSPDAARKVRAILRAEDFYHEPHQVLYRAIVYQMDRNRPTDMLALRNLLTQHKRIDAAGGDIYLAELLDSIGTSTHAEHYAEIVRDKSRRRALVSAAERMIEQAHEAETGAEAIGAADRSLYGLREARPSVAATGGRVLTGFSGLDQITGGFGPGESVLLMALTSKGKTALATAIGRNIVTGSGRQPARPVLYVSREMSCAEIATRMMCAEGQVSTRRARVGTLKDDDWPRLLAAMATLEDWPLDIDDRDGRSVPDIARLARDVVRNRGDLGLVIVDYLGLLEVHDRQRNESEAAGISRISRALKELAGDMGCAVLALHQFNRTASSDKDGPALHHGKGSSSLEQDADIALLLGAKDDGPRREVYVAKNRGGPTGKVPLWFTGRYTRFDDCLVGNWERR